MRTYNITKAVTKADGSPKGISYNDFYDDLIEFEAEDDAAAIAYAEKLQEQHDAKLYVECARLGVTDVNAPYYLNHLYEVTGDLEYEPRKLDT